MTRQYRGITGVVRRAVNDGTIKGLISCNGVRELLPEVKRTAPDKVINVSLHRMAKHKEIQKIHGTYYTKEATKATDVKDTRKSSTSPEVMIMGNLLSTRMEDGKVVATVIVHSLDYT